MLAMLSVRWGFGDIAQKNIQRLRRLPDRGCFFAFQAWKSYLIIMVMIALGVTLRHSSIPKHFLAVAYTAIGGALIVGSFYYYRHLSRLIRDRIAPAWPAPYPALTRIFSTPCQSKVKEDFSMSTMRSPCT